MATPTRKGAFSLDAPPVNARGLSDVPGEALALTPVAVSTLEAVEGAFGAAETGLAAAAGDEARADASGAWALLASVLAVEGVEASGAAAARDEVAGAAAAGDEARADAAGAWALLASVLAASGAEAAGAEA